MPDSHQPGGESPGKAVPGETILDDRIATDESQIVEDKLMGPHSLIDRRGHQDEAQAENDCPKTRRHNENIKDTG